MVKDKPAAAAKTQAKERKKPERKAPVQKDYPNKLAWLKAMTEYEEAQTAASNGAKVERLDKRIAAKEQLRNDLDIEIAKLKAERAQLVPDDEQVEDPAAEAVGA